MRQHVPLFAVASDVGLAPGAPHPPLEPLIELFDERSIFGTVWVDVDLIVRARFGRLADFVDIGVPLSDTVLPMYGLDDQITALRRLPDRSVEVPNVAIHTSEGSTPKLNFNIYWLPKQHCYVMLISRVLSRSDLELELSNQARARTIAEAKLVEKSQEIERANRDLAEFAYVISHDLKAPMRKLGYAADDIAERFDTHPEAATAIADLKAQTRRMSDMLQGLLAYSRIGRKKEAVELVDLRALVDAIVQSFPRPPGIVVAIDGAWDIVPTLAMPFDLVIRNLVDNALKHHDRPTGRITITGGRPAPDRIEIRIADDGPGIPTAYQRAVFQPFVRLKPDADDAVAEAAEGSGIGLSLVRRTVESVGGTLRLESDPPARRGTTFILEWPLLEQDMVVDTVQHVEVPGQQPTGFVSCRPIT
jgi:signal transduction histidine kinase